MLTTIKIRYPKVVRGAMLMVLAVTLTHLQLAKAKAREMCLKDVAHGTIVMMVSI